MATQVQHADLLTLLVGMFDAAPTAELYASLEAGIDAGVTVDQFADAIVASDYFTGLYADTDAFVAGFPTALVGDYVSAEVLSAAETIVAERIADGESVADVIAFALTALSSVDESNETWGAAAAALNNKVEVATYFVETVTGAGYTTVAEMQAILSGVTNDDTTVTSAKATVDALADSIDNAGSTFTLTTANDPIVGTSMNDTITAASGTLNSGDLISDAYSTDNDTLNVTVKTATDMAATATISGIENINVNIDAFAGTAATFNALNVEDATITLSSTKLGYDGAAGVSNAADNNVTAGTNVDTLTVTGLENGVVDAGSAETVNVTGTADDVTNVTVNGDVALNVTTSTELAITATETSEVTLSETAAQVTDITVSGDVTLVASAANVTGDTITGATAVELNAAGTANLVNVDAAITLGADFVGQTVTTADGATVTLGVAQTGTVTFEGDSSNTTNSLTISTGYDVATLNVEDDGLETTIEATDDVKFTALVATGESVVLTGESDVEIVTSDADSFDAEAFTGELTYTTGTESSIVVGTGAENTVTLSADVNNSVTGQSGDDTISALALATKTLAVSSGAGDDTLKVDSTLTSGTLAFTAGEGTDTLWLGDASDLTGATVTLSGVEVIEIEDTGANVSVTLDASTLSGQSFSVTTDDADNDDTATVIVTGDQATIDLSSLTLNNISNFTVNAGATTASTITGTAVVDTITGSSKADTISAGAGNDIIDGNGGADVLTGGAGADTFQFSAGDSTEAAMASITDFTIADFDKLTTANTAAVTGETEDASSYDADGNATDITATATNGVMTLSGDDAAVIDTLAEWIDVAEALLADTDGSNAASVGSLAFEFDGNTYVVDYNAGTQNIIELTGVTGIDAVAATAGTNTLVIA